VLSETHEISATSRSWFINVALPLWFDKGVDWRRGGFFEHLNLDDLKCNAGYKRLRVISRQIYVFSAACRMGETNAKPAVNFGLEYLLDKYWLPSGGYASRTSLEGDIIKGPLDLYDLSFCLYALAHGYNLMGDTHLKDKAISLVLFIADQFKHSSGGYNESLPPSLPRRQNPHMHLLEALLEWRLISDDNIFRDISDEIISLFFDKFYLSQSGALLEYFDNELKPAAGESGGITEPGHHFEWVWLLERYRTISGNNAPHHSKLYEFAAHYGVNKNNGLLWGEVTSHGAPNESRVRLWPHTEWMKAELVWEDKENRSERVAKVWRSLSQFLNCPQPGLWHETFDHEANMFLSEPAPASSLYHIVLAIEALSGHSQSQNKTP
jgi:mannose/cellobiose epimerase-like protein (N-acyl-D-glucosamine 2-epimerase family)